MAFSQRAYEQRVDRFDGLDGAAVVIENDMS